MDIAEFAAVFVATHGEKAADEAAARLLLEIILDNHDYVLRWQAVLDAVVRLQGMI
jgi:hypothetical protein